MPGARSITPKKLGPLLKRLVSLVGRPATDPELVAFVTEDLGKKIPGGVTDASDGKHVVAAKQGLELYFSHDVLNEAYPLEHKTKKTYIPYLSAAWLRSKKLAEPLPLGLRTGMSEEELSELLGPATGTRGTRPTPTWRFVLDAKRAVVLSVAPEEEPYLHIDEARELSGRHEVPPTPVVGVFVAWAATRRLFDEQRLAEQRALLDAIRAREKRGTALLGPLSRGLWDIHLRELDGLREFTFGYFHNIPTGTYIRDDFVRAFGKREGPYGHDEAVLDDDDWKAVDKASKHLDKRFARWLDA